jgi:hypothetical protein
MYATVDHKDRPYRRKRQRSSISVKLTGVFCARVRVEEKQIISAFGDAGAVAMPVLPASVPMPPGPVSSSTTPGSIAGISSIDVNDPDLGAIIDRCTNRYVTETTFSLLRARGVRIIDAGIAGSGSRLDVARLLLAAGLPRPATLVGFSEDSCNAAVRQLGTPCSLLSLKAERGWTLMLDEDTADAVIEHLMVLGTDAESVVLIQSGAPVESAVSTIHLVGGKAIAYDGPLPDAGAVELAERAADILQSGIVAVQIALVNGTQVIWDVLPVADFRTAHLFGEQTMGQAIAAHVIAGDRSGSSLNGEVRHDHNGIAINA